MRLDVRQDAKISSCSARVHSVSARRTLTLFVFCILSLLTFALHPGRVYADARVSLFIPIAANVSDGCALSPEEEMIEDFLVAAPDQQREPLRCNPTLSRVALERAMDMAARDYVNHVNPDGHGPNYLVQQGGYVLPSYYGSEPTSNNVESIAAGYESATDVWNSWMESESHRVHLLGETDFYAEQTDYGIGHVYVASGSTYKHYWVVLTAKPGP